MAQTKSARVFHSRALFEFTQREKLKDEKKRTGGGVLGRLSCTHKKNIYLTRICHQVSPLIPDRALPSSRRSELLSCSLRAVANVRLISVPVQERGECSGSRSVFPFCDDGRRRRAATPPGEEQQQRRRWRRELLPAPATGLATGTLPLSVPAFAPCPLPPRRHRGVPGRRRRRRPCFRQEGAL